MSCLGLGECIKQTELNTYCKHECIYNCELKECFNYHFCKQKRPEWVLNCNNKMCIDCAVNFGKLKFLDENSECPVCFKSKKLVETSCSHNFCLDCWKKWSETSEAPVKCPLCRSSIWN